jgi:SAM-dependent methyltransferase
MRNDAIKLENGRLEGLDHSNYPWFHERHRIFPEIFKDEKYEKILDIAAGMGIAAKRIHDGYPCYMLCNDISSESLKNLKANGLNTISFDLDDPEKPFPFPDATFDAIISLATVEHMINIDKHMLEIKRILKKDGHLYISAPNYSSIHFVVPYLLHGRSFHNPLSHGIDKYEFYAHVRYFTYNTLLEYVSSFGFTAQYVYLPLPKGSARYKALKKKSKILAFGLTAIMYLFYRLLPPRWAFHPVLRFSNTEQSNLDGFKKPKTIIL